MRLFIEAVLPPTALDAAWQAGEQLRRQLSRPDGDRSNSPPSVIPAQAGISPDCSSAGNEIPGKAWNDGTGNGAKVADRAVRWVRREALHLTLRFLGEVEVERLEAAAAALGELEGAGACDLRLLELGSFGGRRPRVLWVGFAPDDGLQQLQRLHEQLGGALAARGFEREPGVYRPHLTLGRVRRQADRREREAIRAAVAAAPPLDVRAGIMRAALVESRLLKDGPRYRRLAVAEL